MKRLSLNPSVARVQPIQSINRIVNSTKHIHSRSISIAHDNAVTRTIRSTTSTKSHAIQQSISQFPRYFSVQPQSVKQTSPDDYYNAHKESVTNPEKFWGRAAEDIEWFSKDGPVLKQGKEPWDYQWFGDRTLNLSHNCLDVHVNAGRGDHVALIAESSISGKSENITYSQLLQEVNAMAAGYEKSGLKQGDRVLIYMPMIREAVVAMLACARLGLTHIVVFGGFAAVELAKRITDSEPKMIVTSSCGLEPKKIIEYKPMLDEAIALSGCKIDKVVLTQREQCPVDLSINTAIGLAPAGIPQPTYIDYKDFLIKGATVAPVAVKATHPLYILHTSGSTGTPKGVVRDTGGYAVALKWAFRNMLDMNRGDVFFSSSDIGWVVGHSYIVYGPLISGVPTVLFEGKPVGTPDAGSYWRTIQKHKVKALYTAPTALRAVKTTDPTGTFIKQYGIGAPESSLKYLFLAGERADAPTCEWAQQTCNLPVHDQMWATETGWTTIGNPVGIHKFPIKAGSAGLPTCGYDIRVFNDEGQEVKEPNHDGNLVIKLPLPPGCLQTLWRNQERYVKSYMQRFHGWFDISDSGHKDEQGYVYVMGRTDDVMNIAG